MKRATFAALTSLIVGVVLLRTFASLAQAHGAEAIAGGSEEAEVAALSQQPARVLAQQALAQLKIRGDEYEARIRLDAALQSTDQSDIDVKLLNKATETLDAGKSDAAVLLLDEALSRPLGSDQGKALHLAGREFSPGVGTQEIVGIIAGAMLLLLGAALLLRGRPGRAA